MPDNELPQSSIVLYQTEDGRTRIQCRFDQETLWLTQAQIAELFQTTAQNVTLHLKAIFAEGELVEEATCKDYLQVRREGARDVSRSLRHYRLEAILAVGYRVRSHRGTQFRQWATARLDEFLRVSGRELLDHAGQISAETARAKAEREYDRYRALADAQPRAVDIDFELAAKRVQKLPRPRKPKS